MPQRWLDRRRRLRRYHVICVQTIGSSDTRELCACARCRWAVAGRLLWQTPEVVGVHYNKPLDTKGVPAANVSARRARHAVTVCATYVGGRRDSVSAQGALCMLCEVSHNSSEVFTSRCQMLLGESANQGRVSRPPNRAFSHPPRSMSSVCGGAVIVALRRCRRSASLEAHAACCIGIPPSGGARVSFLGSRLHVILFPVARCVGGLCDTARGYKAIGYLLSLPSGATRPGCALQLGCEALVTVGALCRRLERLRLISCIFFEDRFFICSVSGSLGPMRRLGRVRISVMSPACLLGPIS